MKNFLNVSQFFFLLLLLFTHSVQSKADTLDVYLPNTQRTWLGENLWANPLQDWQIQNGKIECKVSKPQRNIQLITTEIVDTLQKPFEISVSMGSFEPFDNIKEAFKLGFLLGLKSENNHYKNTCFIGRGIFMGLVSQDSIQIADQKWALPSNIFGQSKKLKLSIQFYPLDAENYQAHLVIEDLENPKKIAKFLSNIQNKTLAGGIGLTADFEGKINSNDDFTSEEKPSFWFEAIKVQGEKVKYFEQRKLKAIVAPLYTTSNNQMRLTVQLMPVGINEKTRVKFQLKDQKNEWFTQATSKIDKEAFTAHFLVDDWNSHINHTYRLEFDPYDNNVQEKCYMEGIIKQEPTQAAQLDICALSCIRAIAFPHQEIVENIKAINPDLLFFAGDQFYEFDGDYGVANHKTPFEIARLDYLQKWYLFGWAFKDVLKDYPTILLMDDHDVFQGNLWGDSGKAAPKIDDRTEREKAGGYVMSAQWLQMAQRTQVAHLPKPYSNQKVGKGITNYFCEFNYANISFAVLEDRKFKSSPVALVKDPYNAPNEMIDVENATLLGDEQLAFLEKWATNWSPQTLMKVALSQTIFSTATTNPTKEWYKKAPNVGEYPEHKMYRDYDTNGWPQKGRKKALLLLKKAGALHICGDQHFGVTGQYGIDNWRDACFFIAAPAVSNAYPRGWFPPVKGQNQQANMAFYEGDFIDAFGNYLSIDAVANPCKTTHKPAKLHDFAPGFSTISIDKKTRNIEINVYPRYVNMKSSQPKPYSDWPIVINQFNNYGNGDVMELPTLNFANFDANELPPLVQIIDQATGEIVKTMRLISNNYQPKVPKKGTYTIVVFKDLDAQKVVFEKQQSKASNKAVLKL